MMKNIQLPMILKAVVFLTIKNPVKIKKISKIFKIFQINPTGNYSE